MCGITCFVSPNGSWHIGQGDAESWRWTDILFTLAHSALLSNEGGASTRPIRCARLKGGGALSKTCSTSFLDANSPLLLPSLLLLVVGATVCSPWCTALGRTISLPSQFVFRARTSLLIAHTICFPVCCCFCLLWRGPCFPHRRQLELVVCGPTWWVPFFERGSLKDREYCLARWSCSATATSAVLGPVELCGERK